LDSGVWPENPSFADPDPNGNPYPAPATTFTCDLGSVRADGTDLGLDFDCNNKLIGAYRFMATFDANREKMDGEFLSARDNDGHGSHTASTVTGNSNVAADVLGGTLGIISGVAPRAQIIAYKVCGSVPGTSSCFGSDSVAAVEQAIIDGVDVINFSIGGGSDPYNDIVEQAFSVAYDNGVFVAASAGNSGPGAGTVAHMSPWLTTVAAGTKDDFYEGSVTLGNGSVYSGASRADAVGPASLVYSADVGLAGANAAEVALCYPGTLDPALVAGKIVACDRGVIARTDKSLAVAQAGGIGSILMNTSASSLNADLHFVPTVHVDHIDRVDILNYIASEGAAATASLEGNNFVQAEAPFVAAFSSRGPNQAGGDLLKPDIMAPGVDILAAVSPAGYNGHDWDFLSGTSMSSPHVAGLGALLTDLHPNWSPAAMKSALMTTASQQTNAGNPIPGGPFAYGAGHVVPNSAADPGLVYDAGFNDWFGFLCGTGQLVSSSCASLGIDPSDLNYPSISIGDLAGVQTVTRKVTNVGAAGVYNVSVDAPAGVNVTVSPTTLDLAAGESGTYEVTFEVTNAATLNAYAFGELVWSDGVHDVQSPLVVYPVQLAAPDEVSGSGTDSGLSFDITFGYEGDYTAAAHGLVAANTTAGSVVDDPSNDINTALGTGVGVTFEVVVIPAGTAYTRISLFDDYTDGNDDLDLYVFGPQSAGFPFVAGSGSGTSAEEVNLTFPAAGVYLVAVHGWQTDGADANYTLFDWSVSATPGGSLSVSAPASATLGSTEPVDVSWSGLAADTKYLGAVSHSDGGGLIGLTVVSVSTE
ncbi:MAG: S8 family serine peptidase, partial [Anaerolineales bacterium]|nr:S8 family serine peptidase [Anaerolineales bacterium]